jgi:hypothetical protein
MDMGLVLGTESCKLFSQYSDSYCLDPLFFSKVMVLVSFQGLVLFPCVPLYIFPLDES